MEATCEKALQLFQATGERLEPPESTNDKEHRQMQEKVNKAYAVQFEGRQRSVDDGVGQPGDQQNAQQQAIMAPPYPLPVPPTAPRDLQGLQRIWDDHISGLRGGMMVTAEELNRQQWLKIRACIVYEAVEAWVTPADNSKDPAVIATGKDPDDLFQKISNMEVKNRYMDRIARELTRGWTYSGQPETWSVLRPLGEGGSGKAFLLTLSDADGRIIGRTVAKDTYLRTWQWSMRRYWETDQLPREASMQYLLADSQKNEASFVRAFRHAVYPEKMIYRIYMEFCPHADLDDVISKHKSSKGQVDGSGKSVRWQIPESAIWAVFDSMAYAACIMELGHPFGGRSPPDWRLGGIIHNDTKANNVFLDSPRDDEWPSFPRFKLGDFGLASYVNMKSVKNPEYYFGVGTDGCKPPEQVEHKPPHVTLTAKSNVNAIGQMIVAMINHVSSKDPAPPQVGYATAPKDEYGRARPFEPTIDDPTNFYTAKLKELAARCARSMPEDRPRTTDLLDEIDYHVKLTPRLANPMRSRKNHVDDALRFHDRHILGLARDP